MRGKHTISLKMGSTPRSVLKDEQVRYTTNDQHEGTLTLKVALFAFFGFCIVCMAEHGQSRRREDDYDHS